MPADNLVAPAVGDALSAKDVIFKPESQDMRMGETDDVLGLADIENPSGQGVRDFLRSIFVKNRSASLRYRPLG